MKTPYDLEIIENCTECTCTNESYFCGFTRSVLESLDYVSHKSTLPAGAILFVEGQAPRGIFVICSGKVNLSTTSREGKILILKTAFPGQALGMSAVISGMGIRDDRGNRDSLPAQFRRPEQISGTNAISQ